MPSYWDKNVEEIELDEVKHQTSAAYLVVVEGEEYWLPKSQCVVDEQSLIADVPRWLCEEKGIL